MRKKSEETSEKVVKNIPTSENGAGVARREAAHNRPEAADSFRLI